MGSQSQHLVEHLQVSNQKSDKLIDEISKIENSFKNHIKQAKRATKKIQNIIQTNKSAKGTVADEEERAALS
jgi:DNA helicase IV